jgi:hypothetical protein
LDPVTCPEGKTWRSRMAGPDDPAKMTLDLALLWPNATMAYTGLPPPCFLLLARAVVYMALIGTLPPGIASG